jgi:peptidoglycan/xylan/chitin deacetylase (PgdA/CDA1 family)
MYLVKTPWWLKKIYPSLTWSIPTREKELYLTFDDGPNPLATPFVLDALKQFNAIATFFCIGKNVLQHPGLYERILLEGHRTGNHTHNHLNGWKTEDDIYYDNIMQAKKVITSNLFRPPYGRIKTSQVAQIDPSFKIVMWDVLSGDFDVKLSPEKSLRYVKAKTTAGSIIVFHDSEKAFKRLSYALPKVLEFFSEQGYKFRSIP